MRIADALDRRHAQQLQEIRCRVTRGAARLTLASASDMEVEIHAAEEKSGLFRDVFGLDLSFATQRARPAGRTLAFHRNGAPQRRASA